MEDEIKIIAENDGQIPYNIVGMMEGFRQYLFNNGIGERTIEEYLKVVRKFMIAIGSNPMNINEQVIFNFLAHKKSWQKISAIKNLCDYLQIPDFEILKKKNKRFFIIKSNPIRKVLNQNDIKAIIGQLAYPYNIIASIQWDTSLRVSAVLNLQLENYNMDDEGYALVYTREKGNKWVTKYLSKETAILINSHLINTGILSGYIFPLGKLHNAYNKYDKALKRASAMQGFLISSHVLRRSRAVQLIRAGENFITVKNFLGHADASTTFKYVESSGQSSKDIIKKEELKNVL